MEAYELKNALKENEDYELIPGEGENWDVRLLEGPFPETVVAFNQLKVSDDEEYLSFNFDLVSSPDEELTEENVDLQQHLADVLNAILVNATQILENKEK
jgi:hypothetical protein